MNFFSLLTILLIALKLLSVIDVSWWIVLSPLLVAPAIFFTVIVGYIVVLFGGRK